MLMTRNKVLTAKLLKKEYEPVSVKTGLNDIEMKNQITALRESINLSECFLKIREDYHLL